MRVSIVSPKKYGYGALLIAGVIKKWGAEISVTTRFHFDNSLKSDIIGVSFQSLSDILNYKNIVKNLREKEKNALLVAGGPATVLPEVVFKHLPWLDLVVNGEGEETIVDVLENFDKKDFSSIKGIARLDGGKLVKTHRKPTSLSGRPPIYIPKDLRNQSIRGSNIYLETHRGCSGRCSFCLVPRLFGRKIRSRPMEEIVQEAKLLKSAGVFRVAISGGTASLYGSNNDEIDENAFQGLLFNLSKIFGKANLTAADLRVDKATARILESIKKYTRGKVEFGIESGSEKMLNLLCKDFTLNDVNETTTQAKKIGLKVTGSFITGHPSETEADFEATRSLVRSLSLHNYAINIAEPIPGTPLFNQIVHLDYDKNPIFQHSEKARQDLDLSISEQRALQLWLDAYETKYGRKCPKATYLRLLRRVRKENARIAKVIHGCAFIYKESTLST
jgi:B12-binding domain/radical SAM domain protein